MPALRTSDEPFANLEGYDFAPHYATVKDEAGTNCASIMWMKARAGARRSR